MIRLFWNSTFLFHTRIGIKMSRVSDRQRCFASCNDDSQNGNSLENPKTLVRKASVRLVLFWGGPEAGGVFHFRCWRAGLLVNTSRLELNLLLYHHLHATACCFDEHSFSELASMSTSSGTTSLTLRVERFVRVSSARRLVGLENEFSVFHYSEEQNMYRTEKLNLDPSMSADANALLFCI